MITLFTFPFCTTCDMIKQKLRSKYIPFQERDFSIIADITQADIPPVLVLPLDQVQGENGLTERLDLFLENTDEILDWINQQRGDPSGITNQKTYW